MTTPYWKKASWNKSMSRLAKQERLAREKKEAEAKQPVKEEMEDMQEGLKPEHNMRPGWMLKADPQLAAKVDANKKKFKEFKKLVGSKPTEKVAEEVIIDEAVEQLDEARINGREYASQGVMHPDHAKMDIHQKTGHDIDFYASGTGDKMQGKVVKNDGKSVHIQAHKDKEMGDGKLHKFKVTPHLPKSVNEELKGDQHKIDVNKNGKLDKFDFAKLRARRKQMKEELEQVDEKINMDKAKMGDVIKDFEKSDAPQFKGKSAEKRREMAIAAKLSNEETEPMLSFKSFLDEGLTEGVWPGTPEYKAKFPETSRGKVGTASKTAKGTQTVTGTGVKHERNYDDSEKDEAPETTEKRGRGRPKGSASGARQKGSAPKSKDGVDYTGYPLHLPGRH